MGSTGPQKLVTVVWSGLAAEVRHIRDGCGLSLEAVCGQLGWQQSKLSRMERGQQCISTADLASLLVIYKVTGHERNQLLHLVERQDEPGRWILDSPLTPTTATLMQLESEAISLVNAQPLLVPGLLQTHDYARAVMKASGVAPELIESRLAKRIERQRVLTKAKPPKFDIILDESVLHRPLGGSAVMARQLRALLEVADRPNVRLWVVPTTMSADVGFFWPTYVIGFPRDDTVVHLESNGSAVYIEDKEKIDFYHRYAARLGQIALNPVRSADLIATIERTYKQE
jgi:Domain of unknown function (DUF5753)/Helix-turn-helix domain